MWKSLSLLCTSLTINVSTATVNTENTNNKKCTVRKCEGSTNSLSSSNSLYGSDHVQGLDLYGSNYDGTVFDFGKQDAERYFN